MYLKYILIFLLISIPASASITINNSNYYINITNVSINFTSPQTFDTVGIGTDSIDINSKTIQFTSINHTNITINQYNSVTNAYNFTLSGNSTLSINHEVTDALRFFSLYINSIQQPDIGSSFLGYILINNIVLSSSPTTYYYFLKDYTTQESYKASVCNSITDQGIIGFQFILILIIAIAGGFAITYIRFGGGDSSQIVQFSLIIIVVVIIGLIVVSMLSKIFDYVGCV